MVVNNVQEHMLLLAEALTVDKQVAEALELYEQILDARNQSGEPTKDIYRTMAASYNHLGKYSQANTMLAEVLKQED